MFSLGFALAAFCVLSAHSSPVEDGRWIATRYGDTGNSRNGDSGKYIPRDEGKYIHVPNPYIHIDNPYDGGYGPYSHQDDPYRGAETRDQYRLVVTPPKDIPFYKDGYYKNNGIKIIRQEHNYDENKYDFLFETENKIRAEEKAVLKNPNTIDEGIASAGFYEYIGPDGFLYRVDYIADQNGFQPKSVRKETQYSGKVIRVKVDNDNNNYY